ncbi:hypothetical protein SAMN05660690_2930 [Geodermatophilus telluris]|uniref:Uncharacterized protein n=1 Tax=Geodermatophilus telluris TaxID=1190417 RepID=A0A1G6QJY1_9ACTN|nr:hypothetical protein SAMN05660690_2930 [Geodermatophilus telluris]
MTASTCRAAGACAVPAAGGAPGPCGTWPAPVSRGARLALAAGLRARGLRGLDVLRRSRDRAPPAAG